MKQRILLTILFVVAGCTGSIDDLPPEEDPKAKERPDGMQVQVECEGCAGSSLLPRLTRVQYKRSVAFALSEDIAAAVDLDKLPSDGRAGPFTSNEALNTGAEEVGLYATMAERVAETAQELYEANCDLAAAECLEDTINTLGARLLRRPLKTAETEEYKALFELAETGEGLRLVLIAMLQSPSFIYRVEQGTEPEQADMARPLSSNEVASRLAFFLWQSGPDDILLEAADNRDLDSSAGIEEQARRMLADPRATATLSQFHQEWLGLDHLEDKTLADDFGEFEALREDMLEETNHFVSDVFFNGEGTLKELFTSSSSFVSPELGELYGVTPDAEGHVEFGDERQGILMQASFLTAHSGADWSTAVFRGLTVYRNILCKQLSDPPDDLVLGERDDSDPLRKQLDDVTGAANCRSCHNLLNPAGFAFGKYDIVGRFSETDSEGRDIDASGELFNTDIETPYSGAIEMTEQLSESDTVDRCMSRQWMRFALGRWEQEDDEASIFAAYEAYKNAGRDIRELIIAITQTSAFRRRALPEKE